MDLGIGSVERRVVYGMLDGLRVVDIHVESTECVGFVGECYVIISLSLPDTRMVVW